MILEFAARFFYRDQKSLSEGKEMSVTPNTYYQTETVVLFKVFQLFLCLSYERLIFSKVCDFPLTKRYKSFQIHHKFVYNLNSAEFYLSFTGRRPGLRCVGSKRTFLSKSTLFFVI